MNGERRGRRHEVWSRSETGQALFHGHASGLTFEDACKHLACSSIDFWRHYRRGCYGGQALYGSAAEALAKP